MLTEWRSEWGYLDCFDSVTLVQPSLALFSPKRLFSKIGVGFGARVRASPEWLKKWLYRIDDVLPQTHKVFSYEQIWSNVIKQYSLIEDTSRRRVFPMAFVDFDNTPRYRDRAQLLQGYSVDVFRSQLAELARTAQSRRPDNIVFINAWNEWGEGMYLQADEEEEEARLDAVRDVSEEF